MRNGKGSGCLAAIIAFSFIGGNTFLFTGMKNLEDNPIAWLMVVFAVIADACAIGFIISFIAKHIGKRKNVNGIGSANHDINYSPVTDNQEKDNISTKEKCQMIRYHMMIHLQSLIRFIRVLC